ncbi:MAG: Spy/CpxP family protein refolding chaperone [Prevotellaceae bacterium]|nr:Spy/CpxP family protein refolding chaperone [Candidatus Minthosoma equi]
MKSLFLSMLLLITATVANAQQRDNENFAKRLFEARLAEMCLQLDLSDEQKSKFAPIYEQYCHEMHELGGGRPPLGDRKPGRPGMRPESQGHRPNRPGMRPNKPGNKADASRKEQKADQKPEAKEPVSDAEKVKRMKERMEKQKKAQDIRLAYTDKFATVLSDKQLVKFYDIESNIQEKLHERAFGKRPRN